MGVLHRGCQWYSYESPLEQRLTQPGMDGVFHEGVRGGFPEKVVLNEEGKKYR